MKKPQTQAAIAKILADCKEGDLFTVVFAPITSPIWIAKEDSGVLKFVDAIGDGLMSRHTPLVVMQSSVDVIVGRISGEKVSLQPNVGSYLYVTAAHLSRITLRASTITSVKIDSLAHDMAFDAKTGECKVGCQTLTLAGCEQAFKALGAHLGYKITG